MDQTNDKSAILLVLDSVADHMHVQNRLINYFTRQMSFLGLIMSYFSTFFVFIVHNDSLDRIRHLD